MVKVNGMVAPGFEAVREVFAGNLEQREVGAACCVYVGGRVVVDLWGGVVAPGSAVPYTERTLQVVASVTKGAMAICGHRLAERGELDFEAPVREYWPEFGTAMPVGWLFSHRAGLPAVDRVLPMAELYPWAAMVGELAGQKPFWEPGAAHGYHAMTYGWLVGEVLRRVSGLTPGELLVREITGPLGLDFWVGLPDSEHGRVAALIPAAPEPKDPLTVLLRDKESLAYKAFFIPNRCSRRSTSRSCGGRSCRR